jgi:hypothetical protein
VVQHDHISDEGIAGTVITIKYSVFSATFDGEQWRSDDADFELMLNDSWERVDVSVSSQYYEGPRETIGLDGLALESAIKLLGDVDVVAYQRTEPELEEEGVDV